MRYSRIHNYMLDELAVGSYQSAVKTKLLTANCRLITANFLLSLGALKLLHESDQCINTFFRHRVIDACTHATD
jgi:hypothetical protein